MIIKADNHKITVSNPQKVLWPEHGITKLQMVEYYQKIAPHMLPHLIDRPISMERFPDGITSQPFYQKEIPTFFPDYFQRVPVDLEEEGHKNYGTVNNTSSLLYLANMASIHIHTWMSRKEFLRQPDMIMWDLDPSDTNFEKIRMGARLLRFVLTEIGLNPYLKTTGSRGLHLAVAIEPNHSTETVHNFSRNVARFITRKIPKLFTTELRKDKRGTKILVDYLRNGFAQTAISPYSLRALPGAPLAAPITWEELDNEQLQAQTYNINNIFDQLKKRDCPWKNFNKNPQPLDPVLEKMEELMKKEKIY